MSLTTAVSGFMVLLLSVSVVQGRDGWGVTYSSHQICALKGSTVKINCTFTYPARIDGKENKLLETFWFPRKEGSELTDVETDLEYSGRVKNTCEENKCTLRITDLRESDAHEYKFRFITNLNKYHGNPGVTLTIKDLQVEVSRSRGALRFKCLSRCPAHTSYIWFKNGMKIKQENSQNYSPGPVLHADRYSCAVQGYKKFPSASVYAPQLPSVSVSPSAEIVENSSVSLTCSSDANPAATYTWYKKNEGPSKAVGPVFTITDFRAEHNGNYYCAAQNIMGRQNSTLHLIVLSGGGTLLVVAVTITIVLSSLVVVFLLLFLWIRKKRSSNESPEAEERADNMKRAQPEEQDDLQYASVCFSKNQMELYSNIRPARPGRRMEQQEVSVYASVANTANRARGQETGEDPGALYSTVNKSR
ncbi:HEPACAM family member 2-like [Notolabrus celidotus]|uniref:HEPACAM family member 2-like n=1 Tax=Notolabrus celidotus TaxID=1203425 RepID=UPI00148F855E|nr:HEPACAM family member 2-like [Notolabrus celidotus]